MFSSSECLSFLSAAFPGISPVIAASLLDGVVHVVSRGSEEGGARTDGSCFVWLEPGRRTTSHGSSSHACSPTALSLGELIPDRRTPEQRAALVRNTRLLVNALVARIWPHLPSAATNADGAIPALTVAHDLVCTRVPTP